MSSSLLYCDRQQEPGLGSPQAPWGVQLRLAGIFLRRLSLAASSVVGRGVIKASWPEELIETPGLAVTSACSNLRLLIPGS